jgi:hypothetical protein
MTDIDTGLSIMCHTEATTPHDQRSGSELRSESISHKCGDMINTISDTIGRRAISKINYVTRVEKLIDTMPRTKRAKIWNDILKFIEYDMILLNEGYEYVDAGDNFIFNTYVEETEQCSLTCADPPYINIKMICGHALSLPFVHGLINKGASESSESIKCPICRKTLIPVMVPAVSLEDKNKLDIKIYKPDDFVDNVGNGDGIVMEKNTSDTKAKNIESVTQTTAIDDTSQDSELGMTGASGSNMIRLSMADVSTSDRARVRPFVRYNDSSGRQVLQLQGGNQRYQITTRNGEENLGEYFADMYNHMQRLLN